MSYPTEGNHRGIDTSIAAAELAATGASLYRYKAHKLLFDHPAGLTVDEVCSLAEEPRYRMQPRLSELRKMGMIRDSGRRRPTVSGANAIVWRATVLDRMEKQA